MAYEHLAKVLAKCFTEIENGLLPNANELETARLDLILALSKSSLAGKNPALQKYLRADLVKLVAAIAGANAINQQLKSLSSSQQQSFNVLQSELAWLSDTPDEKQFWTATV